MARAKRKQYRTAYNYLQQSHRLRDCRQYRRDHLPIGSGVNRSGAARQFSPTAETAGDDMETGRRFRGLSICVSYLSGIWFRCIKHTRKPAWLPEMGIKRDWERQRPKESRNRWHGRDHTLSRGGSPPPFARTGTPIMRASTVRRAPVGNVGSSNQKQWESQTQVGPAKDESRSHRIARRAPVRQRANQSQSMPRVNAAATPAQCVRDKQDRPGSDRGQEHDPHVTAIEKRNGCAYRIILTTWNAGLSREPVPRVSAGNNHTPKSPRTARPGTSVQCARSPGARGSRCKSTS